MQSRAAQPGLNGSCRECMQFDQPDLVVEAIRDAYNRADDGGPLG